MKNSKIILYLMIFISLILCIPSVVYLINNKTVDGFNTYYTYTLSSSNNLIIRVISGLIIIALLLIYTIMYFVIINKEKDIFKNKKQIYIFIIIISFIFMMILPYLSSDIYYYIGDSWLCSKYHQNPYYTTVYELQQNGINDEILRNTGYWKDTVSVYGPLYNMFAIILSKISFGNITIALFVFKLASLTIHILNCYIIYKITKSKKYMLVYGLNPLVLMELLSNVHNDIYLILFLLLSIYFLIRKKNIFLITLFLTFSIAIKYSTILIVPFILLYYYREKKLLKRILWCMLTGIIIIISVILLYMPFFRDLSIFTNMLVQGERYSQSVMLALRINLNNNLYNIINTIKIPIFGYIYVTTIIKYLLKKEITLRDMFKEYNIIMLIFIFLFLTNFQKWYILWLIPTVFLQNRVLRNFILNLTIVAIIPSFAYFIVQNDSFKLGIYYSILVIIFAVILTLIYSYKRNLTVKRSYKEDK